jgi:two-component system chemotaxis response regulator CheB
MTESPEVSDRSPYRGVVIGASAGGIPALINLLALIPPDFSVPILIVLHLPAMADSILPDVLAWHTRLRVAWAVDGDPMSAGRVYVAPPGRHLTVEDGHIRLTDEPPRGQWRPAVDVLFESAARLWGECVIGVVLSGTMWDGARGISAIARAGGMTIVQDEMSADHFDMPAAALDLGKADIAMKPSKIAEALCILTERRP